MAVRVPEERKGVLKSLGKELEVARYLLISEVVDKKVKTQAGVTLGRLQDFVFLDDAKYAEVTNLVVRRPLGRPPLNIPLECVVRIDPAETIVKDPPEGQDYSSFEDVKELLLLRDKILDKRILDTRGFALDVVYDIQLLEVRQKLFIIAAEVGREARRRRLGVLGKLSGAALERGYSDQRIPWKYVQSLGSDLTSTRGDVKLTVTREALNQIPPEDAAGILEELGREERLTIFNVLNSESAAKALGATEPRVQREIIADTDIGRLGQILAYLSPVEIADIISILPEEDSRELLSLLKGDVYQKVHQIVDEYDVPASTLAVKRVLQFPEDLPVEEAFTRFRSEAPQSDVTMYIYAVDPERHLKGVVDINELLQADPKDRLEQIMTRSLVMVSPNATRAKVLELFRKYHFRAIPVVDQTQNIVGAIREKDAFVLEDEERKGRRYL
jgi:CBS domain-containing protein/sporulation protein YlmC with PRC-barrel domain